MDTQTQTLRLRDIEPTPDRQELLTDWWEIDLLLEGGSKLKRSLARFVTQRLGETDLEYSRRLTKFSYANTPADVLKHVKQRALGELRRITSTGAIDPIELGLEVLTDMVTYGQVFLIATAEGFTTINPRLVQRYKAGEWVITLEEETRVPLMGKPEQVKVATVYLPDKVQVYEGKTETLSLIDEYPTGLDRLPIWIYDVPREYNLLNLVYSKAVENLVLSCHLFDLASFVYFQRTYVEGGDETGNIPTKALGNVFGTEHPLKSSLAHILKVEKFEWNEPNGQILDRVSALLDKSDRAIRQLADIPLESELGGGRSGEARAYAFLENTISVQDLVNQAVTMINDALAEYSTMTGTLYPPIAYTPSQANLDQASQDMP